MSAFILALLVLSGQADCPPAAVAELGRARLRAAELDLAGAASQLQGLAANGCIDTEIAATYLRGLIDASAAFRYGGSPASLLSVRDAIASLAAVANGRPGPAEIARLLLQAAAAAAQSERDEMQLYIEAATRMERVQRAAGEAGAPVVLAIEISGDLWLQVYRYEDARRSYSEALDAVGPTPRILAGLARAAVGLHDVQTACRAFRQLLEAWGNREALPHEVIEARTQLDPESCPGLQR